MSSKARPRSALVELFERGEEAVNVFLEELAGSRQARERLGRTVGRAVNARRRVDKNMEAVLSLLGVPSRGDCQRLTAKIETLQGSMVNLNMKLDRLLAAQHARRAPRRAAAPRAETRPRRARGGAAPRQRRG